MGRDGGMIVTVSEKPSGTILSSERPAVPIMGTDLAERVN